MSGTTGDSSGGGDGGGESTVLVSSCWGDLAGLALIYRRATGQGGEFAVAAVQGAVANALYRVHQRSQLITQLRRQDEIFVPRVRARVYKHVLNVNREENYRCIAQERRRREQQRKANRTWQKLLHSLTNERGAWGSKSALGVSSASTSMGYKGTSTHHEGGDKELGASVASALSACI